MVAVELGGWCWVIGPGKSRASSEGNGMGGKGRGKRDIVV
jgi:hypothetical protein